MITNEELQAWGESRRAGAPSPAEAQELVGRVRRRRGWRWLGGLGLVGGAAVAVLLLATVPRLARWSNQETQVEEAPALADVPLHRRHLDAWPEPVLAELGLLSPQREALLFERTYQREVGPRLEQLGLLGEGLPQDTTEA